MTLPAGRRRRRRRRAPVASGGGGGVADPAGGGSRGHGAADGVIAEDAGAQGADAAGVEAAPGLARAEAFDLLISDIGLPDGSGKQAP